MGIIGVQQYGKSPQGRVLSAVSIFVNDQPVGIRSPAPTSIDPVKLFEAMPCVLTSTFKRPNVPEWGASVFNSTGNPLATSGDPLRRGIPKLVRSMCNVMRESFLTYYPPLLSRITNRFNS
jgi:hypothetical protein